MDHFSLMKIAKTAYIGLKAGEKSSVVAKSLVRPTCAFIAGTVAETVIDEVFNAFSEIFEEK